ncbi:DEKNAAC103636 [Brettanomyces naardenensis]|uniref:NADH-cytochrome b5 reductase n=1 Tax=Brettanomyces naardenensis TaxID=13370 RepID=A0A448YNP9_BRENA|nr:DEKNAAC103636 [Brettanomyces naardenensis]
MVTFGIGAGCIVAGIASYTAYARFHQNTAFPSYLVGVTMPLVSVRNLTHDVKLFNFALPAGVKGSGIPPGSASLARVTNHNTGRTYMRPYSVIYSPDDPHSLVFAIKLMNPSGASGAFHSLVPGDKVTFRGPKPGRTVDPSKIESVNLVAGGSGITPLFSILRYLMKEKSSSKVNLIYANKTADDIIFKDEIDRLHKENPDRLSVTYVVDSGEAGPNTVVGRINEELLGKSIRRDGDVFLCGPPAMVKGLQSKTHLLKKYTDKNVVIFH